MAFPPQILSSRRWQMAPGERAAVEGILSQLQPALAIEIGTAQGGSLERIAAHSGHVHTFDLAPKVEADFENVTFHVGDSRELLPLLLRDLEAAGRNVDFVLVDGAHEAEGVERDVRCLLESGAIARTLILLHDTANEAVRAGIRRAGPAAARKVIYLDLDFVGLFQRASPVRNLWGGLGLLVVHTDSTADRVIKDEADPSGSGGSELALRLGRPVRSAVRLIRAAARPLRRRGRTRA